MCVCIPQNRTTVLWPHAHARDELVGQLYSFGHLWAHRAYLCVSSQIRESNALASLSDIIHIEINICVDPIKHIYNLFMLLRRPVPRIWLNDLRSE